MLEHKAKSWNRMNTILMRQISLLSRKDGLTHVSEEDLTACLNTLRMVERHLTTLGLPVSLNIVTDLVPLFEARNQEYYYQLVIQEMETVVTTVTNELDSLTFLKVSPEYARYYSDIQPFGAAVADAFSKANKDIEMGGKALACGLGTATVFHMMRIMELGLKALSKPLGIAYAPSWESYISQIEKKITAKHPSKSAKWKKQEPLFRDILGDLQAIKIAWRNPTMHIVRHYDQDEGEDVFRMVKRFMRRLAENGFSQV